MKKSHILTVCAMLTSGLSFGQFVEKHVDPQPYEFNPPGSAKVEMGSRATKQRFDSTVYYSYIGGTQLELSAKEVVLYDNNFRQEGLNRYNYSNNTWVHVGILSLSYDQQGNITEFLNKTIDTASGVAQDNWKESYTYDVNNFSIRYTASTWGNNVWTETRRSFYTPNPSGQTSDIYTLNWNKTSQQWDSSYYFVFIYDNNGNFTQKTTYRYVSGSWVESTKIENMYNSNNLKIQATSYSWNGQWDRVSQYNYTLDANNNIVFAQSDKWKNNQWEPSLRYNKDFDMSYTSNDLITPYWYNENNLLRSQNVELVIGGNWTLVDSMQYYYSPQTVNSVLDLETKQVEVYPNPVTDMVTFQIPNDVINPTVEVYDMKGMLMISRRLQATTLDVSFLGKGAYYFLIIDKDITYSGKLMKL